MKLNRAKKRNSALNELESIVNPTPNETKDTTKPFLSKSDLTLGLALFAAILSVGPYLFPQVQKHLVREGLLKNPEILADASRAYETMTLKKQDEEFQKLVKANISMIISPDDAVIGPKDAPISIVEFSDYLCSFCKLAAPEVDAILKANPDVRLVVKELPVINPDQSPYLSALALAAKDSGRFKQLHDSFYSHPLKTEAEIKLAVSAAGLDYDKLKAKAESPEIAKIIMNNKILATRLQFNATPMFVIGDRVISGARPEEMIEAIQSVREKKKS